MYILYWKVSNIRPWMAEGADLDFYPEDWEALFPNENIWMVPGTYWED